MHTIRSSKILNSRTKNGSKKYWQAHVAENNSEYFTLSSFWQDTKDGTSKVQYSEPYKVEAKNLGKSNETTEKEQAFLEFDRMVQHQKDKGYHEAGEKSEVLLKPMLAHDFKKHGKKLEYPYFTQPKLDGFRMLMDGKKGWTRGGKLMVPECISHLLFDTQGYIVDGELILPGNQPLQVTSSAAKKFKEGVSDTLQYRVYDVVCDNLVFSERYDLLKKLVANAPENVILVETEVVRSEDEVKAAHRVNVSNGFEGTILRDNVTPYEIGNRSYSLQKYKDFVDDEFRIVNVLDGEGKFKGKAIFECITLEGELFNVVPKGTMEYREKLFREKDKLIGKDLTVRYQSLSNLGIPVFPVAIGIRDFG